MYKIQKNSTKKLLDMRNNFSKINLKISVDFLCTNEQIEKEYRKTIWRLLKKLNIDLPYDPAIPLLGLYLKECESG
jgi:hypothetical protein